MKRFEIKNFLAALGLIVFILPAILFAGASGTITGYVIDKETGNRLPGASIIIDGTNFGAMADKYGFYIIYNVPVGAHIIRASMIGYVPMRIKNVEVKTDINTMAHFELQSRVLELGEEIVVTAPRVQILRDVLSSTTYLGQETITKSFPAQNFYDFLPMVPGYVANHFRGGRNSGVQYLIDGLPAGEAWTRSMAFSLPVTALAEMVVQTGGFSAEYGDLTSGLVNLITKDGRNNLGLSLKLVSDFPSRADEVFTNNRRAEAALGGPLKLDFGGPLLDANYFISGKAEYNDTPQRRELRRVFHTPIFLNYDWNAKVMMRLSPKVFLRGQILASRWNWRKHDPLWAQRESALPQRLNDNRRLSFSFTHTPNPRMFYQIELSHADFHRQVLGEIPAGADSNYIVNSPAELAAIWPGEKEPWKENLRERHWLARAHMTRQLNPIHQLKLGVAANYWNLDWQSDRYLLWPDGKLTKKYFVYSRYTDALKRRPFSLAGYVHHKIELENFLATFGLRYELFSSNSTSALAEEQAVVNDSIAPLTRPKVFHHTLAPRLGLAIPIGNVEHLSINYGWFYELPAFYHLYSNTAGARSSYWNLYGNPALKPVQATAWEITYRRAITEQTVFALTGFWRKYLNLTGTAGYYSAYTAQPPEVFQYASNAKATSGGLEMSYRRQFSREFSGAATYTYSHSSGTAPWPESKFLRISRSELPGNDNYETPLAWDQRHALSFFLSWQNSRGYVFSLFSQIYGPATATDWLHGEAVDLGWRQFLSAKFSLPVQWLGLRLQSFCETRNVLNVKYAYPEQNGLDFSLPSAPFEDNLGRRIWVGISLN